MRKTAIVENRSSRRIELESAERTSIGTAVSDAIETVDLATLAFAAVGPAIPEDVFKTGRVGSENRCRIA